MIEQDGAAAHQEELHSATPLTGWYLQGVSSLTLVKGKRRVEEGRGCPVIDLVTSDISQHPTVQPAMHSERINQSMFSWHLRNPAAGDGKRTARGTAEPLPQPPRSSSTAKAMEGRNKWKERDHNNTEDKEDLDHSRSLRHNLGQADSQMSADGESRKILASI